MLSTVLTIGVILSPVLQMRTVKLEKIYPRLHAMHRGPRIRTPGVWLESKHYAMKGVRGNQTQGLWAGTGIVLESHAGLSQQRTWMNGLHWYNSHRIVLPTLGK